VRLCAAFWDAYRMTDATSNLWPADETQARDLVDLFKLEKAFYEIEYELSNRPSWAHIPLEGTCHILNERGVYP